MASGATGSGAGAGTGAGARAITALVDGKVARVVVAPVTIAGDEDLMTRANQFVAADDRVRAGQLRSALDRRRKAVLSAALREYTEAAGRRGEDGAVSLPVADGGRLIFRATRGQPRVDRSVVAEVLRDKLGDADAMVGKIISALFDEREGERRWSMRRVRPRGAAAAAAMPGFAEEDGDGDDDDDDGEAADDDGSDGGR